MQNTGGASVASGGFSFGISTLNPGITFKVADISTVIFARDSLFGPNIQTSTGTALVASDNPALATSFPVGSGATVGLGHGAYLISAGAATGPFTITPSVSGGDLAVQRRWRQYPDHNLDEGNAERHLEARPASLGLF